MQKPETLLNSLQQIRHLVVEEGTVMFNEWRSHIEREVFTPSALNLAYYLALRRHDLRSIQVELIPWGLSSLGQIEARVLPNLDAIIATLGAICNQNPSLLPNRPPLEAFFEGDRILKHHTEEIFGTTPKHRQVRIMVTMPTEAATKAKFVHNLLKRGVDCIRINCAHDTPEEWEKMIKHLRQAEAETGRSCKVFMDLSGPKIRLDSVVPSHSNKRLVPGDAIMLTPTTPTKANPQYCQGSCKIPEIFAQVKTGATVWIDDGKIGACVESVSPEGLLLRITHARPKGEKLRPDKGLNFPDSYLNLSPLSNKDLQDLDFVAHHADLIGYSFVQQAQDIELLQRELQARLGEKWRKKAIIVKVETQEALRNLPELMIQSGGKQPFGVMIARGDLAVEIGYQRLAEIQEEILWLCQAAHIPVIWATQVLENLVKKSIPSRAEITDAAMAERAECVMLNKGEFIEKAVTILDDVLTRMQAHQSKKTSQLRALQSW